MVCYSVITLLFFLVICISFTEAAHLAHLIVYVSPNASTIWTNNNHSIPALQLADDSFIRLVLNHEVGSRMQQNGTLTCGCGFYCRPGWGGLCQFSILYLLGPIASSTERIKPQAVWSANRHHLVGENATLEFSHGDLVLKDKDGVTVWSSNTSSQMVSGMRLDSGPNLVLFNASNHTVWQSFDHPTDTLLSGQQLKLGQRLTSGPGPQGSSVGLFSLSLADDRLTFAVHMDKSIPYLDLWALTNLSASAEKMQYASFDNGIVTFGYDLGDGDGIIRTFEMEETQWLPPSQFMRLDADGDLRIYSWSWMGGWEVAYAFAERRDPCIAPLQCGYYGVCRRGHCSCPGIVDGTQYFSPYDERSPELGCSQDVSIKAQGRYEMVDFRGLDFVYMHGAAAAYSIELLDDCQRACLANASCKAVYFTQDKSNSNGSGRCYLSSRVLTMQGTAQTTQRLGVSSTYLKVRVPGIAPLPAPSPLPSLSPSKKTKFPGILELVVVVVATITSSFILILVIAFRRRRLPVSKEEFNEPVPVPVPGLPVRLSYEDLCTATGEFAEKIGRGGFGTVFRGVLTDGTPVAVKRLDGDGQGMDEFVAEMKTIGSIHHVNLVQLMGYCAEKTHRLLVYEYMSNGSLDKWIFGSKKEDLDWKTKIKIITDIAKGLAYLHEECRQSIAHLDMKPHNVLLDDEFNAKISDFGLARVMDRDRSQMTNTLRGTLGYLAPEWQASEHITVKVDIYSFGIIMLETLCGRKNLDYNQQDSRIHLLSLLIRKTNDYKLTDILQNPRGEIHYHDEEEALKLIRIGLWCLNDDYKKRPSMSTVVEALEGGLEVENEITYRVSHTMIPSTTDGALVVSSPTI